MNELNLTMKHINLYFSLIPGGEQIANSLNSKLHKS